MTNRIPLVVDSVALSIKELPTNDNLDLTNSGIVNATTASFSGNVTTGNVSATRMIASYSDVGTVTSGTWQGTNLANTQITGIHTIAQGGTNASSLTSPTNSVQGLMYYDGTKITNDSNVYHVGYNETTSTFHANNVSISGTLTTSSGTPASTGKAVAMGMIFGF